VVKRINATFENVVENYKEVVGNARNRAAFFKDLSELVYEAVDAWEKGKVCCSCCCRLKLYFSQQQQQLLLFQ
jgi:hypothetical protein